MRRICMIYLLTAIPLWYSVSGATPATIYYEGQLKDPSGNLLHGEFKVEFTIYNAAEDGQVLWRESHGGDEKSGILADSGFFGVELGTINPIPDSIINENGRWLGIKVGTDPEMRPREMLVKGAYSYRVSGGKRAGTERRGRNRCQWHERNLPGCRIFSVTECGLKIAASSSLNQESIISLSTELGLVNHLGDNNGLGGSVYMSWEEDDGRVGPRIRYRRWFDDNAAVDVASGVTWNILRGNQQQEVEGKMGYAGYVGLNLRDIGILFLEYDIFPTWCDPYLYGTSKKTQKVLYLGASAGSKPGLLANLGLGALLLLVIIFPPRIG